MRNFEADQVVRLGDVLDTIERVYKSFDPEHYLDLGDAGLHSVMCDMPGREEIEERLKKLAR